MNDDKKSETQYIRVDSTPLLEKDEIDLLELTRTILQSWKLIVGITIIFTSLAVVYAMLSQEMFKAETLLVSAQEEKSGTSSLSQFGGLAAMAGISIPRDSNTEEVIATLRSRKFLSLFINKNKLLPVLFDDLWDLEKNTWILGPNQDEPTINDGYSTLRSSMTIDEDKKSGLITLAVYWKNPEVVAEWTNDLVKELNEQLREQAIADSKKRVGYLEQELAKTTLQDMRAVLYNLLESEKQKAMLANVNEDFALEVIDPAFTPKQREKPNRKVIVVLGGVCGGFLGMFAVFFLQFIKKLQASNPKPHPSHV